MDNLLNNNLTGDDRFLSLTLDLESVRSDSHAVGLEEQNFDWGKFKSSIFQLKEIYDDIRLEILEIETSLEIDGAVTFLSGFSRLWSLVSDLDNLSEQDMDEVAPMVCSFATFAIKNRICQAKMVRSASITLQEMLLGESRNLASFGSEIFNQLKSDDELYGNNLLEHFEKVSKDYSALINWFASRADYMPFDAQPMEHLFVEICKSLSGDEFENLHNMSESKQEQRLMAEEQLATNSITRRADAIKAIDKIVEYFEFYEPGHPSPILLKRARKLVGMKFEDIVNDMFPEAQGSLEKLSGQAQQNF